jgi:hypothetical protein
MTAGHCCGSLLVAFVVAVFTDVILQHKTRVRQRTQTQCDVAATCKRQEDEEAHHGELVEDAASGLRVRGRPSRPQPEQPQQQKEAGDYGHDTGSHRRLPELHPANARQVHKKECGACAKMNGLK